MFPFSIAVNLKEDQEIGLTSVLLPWGVAT